MKWTWDVHFVFEKNTCSDSPINFHSINPLFSSGRLADPNPFYQSVVCGSKNLQNRCSPFCEGLRTVRRDRLHLCFASGLFPCGVWLVCRGFSDSFLLYNIRIRCLYAVRYHLDRKSTRLNSSHVAISYAVFC